MSFWILSRRTSASPLSRMLAAMRVKSPFSQSALFGFMPWRRFLLLAPRIHELFVPSRPSVSEPQVPSVWRQQQQQAAYVPRCSTWVALAWLVRWGQLHGFPAWLRTGVIALYVAALLTGNFGPETHLVVTPLIGLGAFALAVAAAWQERGRAQVSPTLRGRGLGEGAAAPISRVVPSR